MKYHRTFSYVYKKERGKLFTDTMQRVIIKARDEILRLLDLTGAISEDHAANAVARQMGSSDSWTCFAVIDRLVEIGDLHCVELVGGSGSVGRIFVRRTW